MTWHTWQDIHDTTYTARYITRMSPCRAMSSHDTPVSCHVVTGVVAVYRAMYVLMCIQAMSCHVCRAMNWHILQKRVSIIKTQHDTTCRTTPPCLVMYLHDMSHDTPLSCHVVTVSCNVSCDVCIDVCTRHVVSCMSCDVVLLMHVVWCMSCDEESIHDVVMIYACSAVYVVWEIRIARSF